MSRILALVSIATFTVLCACSSPGDVDTDAWAFQAEMEAVFAASDLDLDQETLLNLAGADDPVPAWEYLDAAPMGELTEGIPRVFSGDISYQGYAVAEVVVPASGGELRVDPSYCGTGNTGCVVYVAVDRDGDTMLEASEVEATADGRLGEVAEASVDGGVWTVFVAGSVASVDGFVVEVLWSVAGGSDGTAS